MCQVSMYRFCLNKKDFLCNICFKTSKLQQCAFFLKCKKAMAEKTKLLQIQPNIINACWHFFLFIYKNKLTSNLQKLLGFITRTVLINELLFRLQGGCWDGAAEVRSTQTEDARRGGSQTGTTAAEPDGSKFLFAQEPDVIFVVSFHSVRLLEKS